MIISLDVKIKFLGIKIGLKIESKVVGCLIYVGGDFCELMLYFVVLRD